MSFNFDATLDPTDFNLFFNDMDFDFKDIDIFPTSSSQSSLTDAEPPPQKEETEHLSDLIIVDTLVESAT